MFNLKVSKKFFKILAEIQLILGTLGSVYYAYDKGRTLISEYYDVYERDLWNTIIIFASSFYKVIIVFAILQGLYMIFDYLEYFYSEKDAKLSSVKFLDGEDNEYKEKKWRCEECGKLNDGYRSICGCGASKPE